VGIIYKKDIKIREKEHVYLSTFEQMSLLIQGKQAVINVHIIYRPPTRGLEATNDFLNELIDYLTPTIIKSSQTLILGDFNYQIDNVLDNTAKSCMQEMTSLGLIQYVADPTHSAGHILDLIFESEDNQCITNLEVKTNNLSDHFSVFFTYKYVHDDIEPLKISKRCFRDLDRDHLREIVGSRIKQLNQKNLSIDELIEEYNEIFTNALDEVAPMRNLVVSSKSHAPWFNNQILEAKRKCRRSERRWKRTNNISHYKQYENYHVNKFKTIKQSKEEYLLKSIEESSNDSRKLYRALQPLVNSSKKTNLPSASNTKELCNKFSDFFENKIESISRLTDCSSCLQ